MAYVTDLAPTKPELSACVQCGLCLPFCPTFRLTGKEIASPRGRLTAMSAVLEGITPIDEVFDDAMTFCLQCRACEAVCPGLVPFGRVMEGARAELALQRPTPTRRVTGFALGKLLPNRSTIRLTTLAVFLAQRLGLHRLLGGSLRRSMTGLRRLRRGRRSWVGRSVQPLGQPRGTAALLAGCVMDPWFAEVHDATVGLLRRAGFRVVVPKAQTCCGALAAHDGAADAARRLAQRNSAAFDGVEVVVADAAGCSAHLKDYEHWAGSRGAELAARVKDVTEIIADMIEEGSLPRVALDLGPVAVQDPCHLRHAQRVMAQPRAILAAAGYTPVETDPDGLCCGAAGVYSVLHPEESHELGKRKADQIRNTVSTIVASANPGCEMQLRSHLGDEYRVVHPVELYWEAITSHPEHLTN